MSIELPTATLKDNRDNLPSITSKNDKHSAILKYNKTSNTKNNLDNLSTTKFKTSQNNPVSSYKLTHQYQFCNTITQNFVWETLLVIIIS
jgi:hypothetical protein